MNKRKNYVVFILVCMAAIFVSSMSYADITQDNLPRYDISVAPNAWDPNVTVSPKKYLTNQFTYDDKIIDEIVVPGRPPVNFRMLSAIVPRSNSALGITILSNVPAFDWSYGCSATSAAMMMGYYDNSNYPNMYTGSTNGGVCPMNNSSWGYGECPLSATHQGYDGRSIKGHVDDYWWEYGNNNPDPFIGNWTEHILGDCTADYMGTNQSNYGNSDGSTTFYNYNNGTPIYNYTLCEPANIDGCHGIRDFVESRGYQVVSNYSQYIYGYNGNTLGFTFDQFKNEIDSGRPVMIQVAGHSMVGYGYDSSNQTVYIHDTWDHNSHTMTWGGSYAGMQHYGVTVIQLDMVEPPLVINQPYEYTWYVGQAVSDSLSASGGVEPYHDWMASSGEVGYTNTILDSSLFSAIGTAKNWKADDGSWSYTLPFTFPFYGLNRTSVNVCSNGFIDFTSTAASYSNSTVELISSARIAPLWDDLLTTNGNIYIDESVSDQVTIRWAGVTYQGNKPVNFSTTLFSDGRIRFDYGNGNTNLTPTVGISAGNGTDYMFVSGYDNAGILTNADSVMFTPLSAQSFLPEGVTLDPNTGQFSGTPTTPGTYFTTIQVSDNSSPVQTAQQEFVFNINKLVTGVILNKTTLMLGKDATETLIATVSPDDATNKVLDWSSNNTSVATVDNNGKVTGISEGTCIINAKTTDGSELSASANVTVDATKPVIAIDSIKQKGVSLTGNALKGTVDITISASDALSGLAGDPDVSIKDSAGSDVAFTKSGSVYTATINAATANGTCTIKATATDNVGNANTAISTFNVNKNEVSGKVTLPGFVGTSRDVTFYINGTIAKTVTLSFSGGSANYTLVDIADVTTLSAKTNWTLRKKLSVTPTNGQASGINFTLPGGDLNNSNSVNALDYSLLKSKWFTHDASCDINGDGSVTVLDYGILKTNYFTNGDAK